MSSIEPLWATTAELEMKSHNLSVHKLVNFNRADFVTKLESDSCSTPVSPKGWFSEWIHQHVLTACFHLMYPCHEKYNFSSPQSYLCFLFLSDCLVLTWECVLGSCDERDLLLAVVWLSSWQLARLFIFLFISGALNRHMLGLLATSAGPGRWESWEPYGQMCVDCDVSHQRCVSWELLDLTHLDLTHQARTHIYHNHRSPPTMRS